MNEFRQRLKKVVNITPEAFFRICDYQYSKEVSTADFKKKIQEIGLGLAEITIHRLISVLDEDFNGSISLEEYYFALDTYGCRCEDYGPFDGSKFISFQWKSVYKLLEAMKKRQISLEELFRSIDVDNDKTITLSEMEDTIKIFSSFKVKELHSIHNYFDVDNNGSIDEREYRG